jgi:hypothetical protein
MKVAPNLSVFDGKLMNGLDFCRKVYDLVNDIRKSPNDIDPLGLRNGPELKKIVEKLIPLSKYIQGCYGPNQLLKVRWINGRDGHDAQVLSSGAFVDKRLSPRRRWIEITAIVHEHNPHLRLPRSKRQLRYGGEAEANLAQKILEQVQTRGAIKHPRHTVLVIECFLSNLFLQDQWERTIAIVRERCKRPGFSEIFVCDSNLGFSATIHGRPRQFISTKTE